MSSHLAGILDGVLVGAVGLGLGVWQLWSLRQEERRRGAEQDGSGEGARHLVGEHPEHEG